MIDKIIEKLTDIGFVLIEDFKVEFSKYLDYYKNLYGEFEIKIHMMFIVVL